MGFNNIEKKDRWYKLLHLFVIFTHNRIFYRKVYISNADRIPKNSHLIFTPNHQNALMDALAPLCNIDQQLVFLARSDIFQKKAIASILYFLKILPVFRIRDGYSSVKKNKDTFQKTIDVIKAQNGLVILPEGYHEGVHRLRTLKKGFARIAFQTEEASNFLLDIKIVPMGLHYSDYIKSRSDLYINFGEPIPVSNYYELYKEAPAKAINKITSDLAEKIKPLMVHIESIDHYDVYDSLRVMYWENVCLNDENENCSKSNRINAEQKVIKSIEQLEENEPDQFTSLCELNGSFRDQISKTGIKAEVFKNPVKLFSLIINSMCSVIGFPIALYGLIINILPIAIVKYSENKIKDLQFKSSFKFVLSLVVFPLFYIILSILFFVFSASFWYGLILTLSLPITGAFALYYFSSLVATKIKWKLWLLKRTKPATYKEIQKTKAAMDQIINDLII